MKNSTGGNQGTTGHSSECERCSSEEAGGRLETCRNISYSDPARFRDGWTAGKLPHEGIADVVEIGDPDSLV